MMTLIPLITPKGCYDFNTRGGICHGSPQPLNQQRFCNVCACYIGKLKPPLGIMPKKLHRQERIQKLAEAILRYSKACLKIPEEWIKELDTVNRRIYNNKDL